MLGQMDSLLTRHFGVPAAALFYHMFSVTHQHASRSCVLGVITKSTDFRVSTIALIGIFQVMNLEFNSKEQNYQLPHSVDKKELKQLKRPCCLRGYACYLCNFSYLSLSFNLFSRQEFVIYYAYIQLFGYFSQNFVQLVCCAQ